MPADLRAQLERLIETWRERSRTYCHGFVRDGHPEDDLRAGYAVEVIQCANELEAALLALPAETPAPRPGTPSPYDLSAHAGRKRR